MGGPPPNANAAQTQTSQNAANDAMAQALAQMNNQQNLLGTYLNQSTQSSNQQATPISGINGVQTNNFIPNPNQFSIGNMAAVAPIGYQNVQGPSGFQTQQINAQTINPNAYQFNPNFVGNPQIGANDLVAAPNQIDFSLLNQGLNQANAAASGYDPNAAMGSFLAAAPALQNLNEGSISGLQASLNQQAAQQSQAAIDSTASQFAQRGALHSGAAAAAMAEAGARPFADVQNQIGSQLIQNTNALYAQALPQVYGASQYANQAALQGAGLALQGADTGITGQQANAQLGLQAALANQGNYYNFAQLGQNAQIANQQADLAAQQYGAQYGQAASLANQQAALQAQLANQQYGYQGQYDAAQLQQQAALANQQTGLAAGTTGAQLQSQQNQLSFQQQYEAQALYAQMLQQAQLSNQQYGANQQQFNANLQYQIAAQNAQNQLAQYQLASQSNLGAASALASMYGANAGIYSQGLGILGDYGTPMYQEQQGPLDYIGQGVGIVAAGKAIFLCVPKGEKVDTARGSKRIEKIRPGDTVLGLSGNPVKVLQVHAYNENPDANRFLTIQTNRGTLTVCEKHRIGFLRVRAEEYKVGDVLSGRIVTKIIRKAGVRTSYDLLTEDGGYRIDSIPILSMIPEMAKFVRGALEPLFIAD